VDGDSPVEDRGTLAARDEVTMRERGSPPWAFALAQVRIRSAGGPESVNENCDGGPTMGQNGSHEASGPSSGLVQQLVVVPLAKSPRVGTCGPSKA
jgi:hypothetical protein